MQKDIHFYLTFALAVKAGQADALTIAWADQYTDDLTKAQISGIQTQSAVLGNWSDRQIQNTVLVPFHFIPGSDRMVVENNTLAQLLVEKAGNPFELGIALHALQDTFSHQGFSGWDEPANSCFAWWYIQSITPNIGHAEMGAVPDMADMVWTDPRSGEFIDNKERALRCALKTYTALGGQNWPPVAKRLEGIFKLPYDERKKEFQLLAGESVRYLHPSYSKLKFEREFIAAARKHLGRFMKYI